AFSAMSVQIAAPAIMRGIDSRTVGRIGRREMSMVVWIGGMSADSGSSILRMCSTMNGCGSSRWSVFKSLVTRSNLGRKMTGSLYLLYTWKNMYQMTLSARWFFTLSNIGTVMIRGGLYRKLNVHTPALSR